MKNKWIQIGLAVLVPILFLYSQNQVELSRPDLSVKYFTVTPQTMLPGAGLRISYTVKNNGSVGSGRYRVRIIYSENNQLDPGDQIISSITFAALPGRNEQRHTVTDRALPASARPGRRFIYCKIEPIGFIDKNGENNVKFYPVKVNVPPRPDLKLTILSVSPDRQTRGGRVSVQYKIENTGPVDCGIYQWAFYYSSDRRIGTDDAKSHYGSDRGLRAGGSVTRTAVVTIPGSATPGDHYVGGLVDYMERITESNEFNNSASTSVYVMSGELPDLQILGINTVSPELELGKRIQITARVKNVGPVSCTSSCRLQFYLSRDYRPDRSDLPLMSISGGLTLRPLGAGADTTAGYTGRLPEGATTGSRYIIGVVDVEETVTESNELNNWKSVRCTVIPPKKPDLKIINNPNTFTIVPRTASPGQRVAVKYRIYNNGEAPCNIRPAYFKIMLSADSIIDNRDIPLLIVSRIAQTIQPGTHYPQHSGQFITSNVTIPTRVRPGRYFIGIMVDATGAIEESDETNNTVRLHISVVMANVIRKN